MQYYDLVLLCVGSSLILGGIIGSVTAIPLTLSMPVLGLVGIAVILHALFINGPVDTAADLSKEVEPEDVPALSPLEGHR